MGANIDVELAKMKINHKISNLEQVQSDLANIKSTVMESSSNCHEKDKVLEKIRSIDSQLTDLIDRYESDVTYIESKEEVLEWI